MGGTWVATSWAAHLGEEKPWGRCWASCRYEVVPVRTGILAGCEGRSSSPPVSGEVVRGRGVNKRLFYVFLTHTASLAGAQARAGAGAACVIAETWLKSPFFPPKLNQKQPSSLLTQVTASPCPWCCLFNQSFHRIASPAKPLPPLSPSCWQVRYRLPEPIFGTLWFASSAIFR